MWTSSPRLWWARVGLLLRVGPAWGTRSDSSAPSQRPGLWQSRSCECRRGAGRLWGVPREDFGQK